MLFSKSIKNGNGNAFMIVLRMSGCAVVPTTAHNSRLPGRYPRYQRFISGWTVANVTRTSESYGCGLALPMVPVGQAPDYLLLLPINDPPRHDVSKG